MQPLGETLAFVARENFTQISLRFVRRWEPVGHHRPFDRSVRHHLGLGLSWSFVFKGITVQGVLFIDAACMAEVIGEGKSFGIVGCSVNCGQGEHLACQCSFLCLLLFMCGSADPILCLALVTNLFLLLYFKQVFVDTHVLHLHWHLICCILQYQSAQAHHWPTSPQRAFSRF